jgi:hypothetical protein
MDIDEFVKTKVLPEYQDVVGLIRRYMHEMAPGAQEVISYGLPVYKGKKIMAVISPNKKRITLSFSRGMQFEDKYSMLKGEGKSSQHLKFKSVDDVKKDVVEYYIKQALDLDSK